MKMMTKERIIFVVEVDVDVFDVPFPFFVLDLFFKSFKSRSPDQDQVTELTMSLYKYITASAIEPSSHPRLLHPDRCVSIGAIESNLQPQRRHR